jgi:hypothetical protein
LEEKEVMPGFFLLSCFVSGWLCDTMALTEADGHHPDSQSCPDDKGSKRSVTCMN